VGSIPITRSTPTTTNRINGLLHCARREWSTLQQPPTTSARPFNLVHVPISMPARYALLSNPALIAEQMFSCPGGCSRPQDAAEGHLCWHPLGACQKATGARPGAKEWLSLCSGARCPTAAAAVGLPSPADRGMCRRRITFRWSRWQAGRHRLLRGIGEASSNRSGYRRSGRQAGHDDGR
jgi:hypothetical protein